MFPVLFPHGIIGSKESALLIQATLLMLIVIIPVLALLFYFAWKYRAGQGSRYEPEWEHSALDELVWWAVPIEIVLVLAAVTWVSTHKLDPHKSLVDTQPTLTVEVVALPWKWLFIYPAQNIATVNELMLPAGVPIKFDITADAPMNSFWIPALGGQIYAMTGMDNTLYLRADEPGTYQGLSANYSGDHFADMHFTVRSVTEQSFDAWVQSQHSSSTTLNQASYAALAQPSTSTPRSYSNIESGFFDAILNKYAQQGDTGHHH